MFTVGINSTQWGPKPLEIGPTHTRGFIVGGRAMLGGKPAELWEVRRLFPSVDKGKYVLIAVAALANDATAARRAEFFAVLSTFSPTPEQ